MSTDILSQLKEKFDSYDLWDIAGDFYNHYKLAVRELYPEGRFENDELPNDDCFRTLVAVKEARKREKETSARDEKLMDTQIKALLCIPYKRIQDTQAQISKLLGYPPHTIERWYAKNMDLFYVTPEMVREMFNYLSEAVSMDICKAIFQEALVLGYKETRHRIEFLKETVGTWAEEVLYEMYCRNGRQGFLLFPYYTGPVSAIEYLKDKFDPETIAHILKTDFWFLYAYKDTAYHGRSSYGHDQGYIDELVGAYQNQMSIAKSLRDLARKITPYDYDEQWEGEFLPLYREIKEKMLRYPISPKLQRALYAVIMVFERCGMHPDGEFSRFSMDNGQ